MDGAGYTNSRRKRCYRIPGERRIGTPSCDPPLPRPSPYHDPESTLSAWMIYWMATIPGEQRSLRWMELHSGVNRETIRRLWDKCKAALPSPDVESTKVAQM